LCERTSHLDERAFFGRAFGHPVVPVAGIDPARFAPDSGSWSAKGRS
jgi:hypothetical protein